MNAEERELVLALGRGTVPAEALEDPIPRLLRTARAHPGHAAVVFDGASISYEVLVRRAGQLAGRLRELGVRRGSRVGICMVRGPDELLCMLATWAAGGAYVPLDPTHPPDRTRLILEDAAPDVLISESALLPELSVPDTVAALCLDREREALARREPLFEAEPDPEQLAYVLFTSGSTGRPKGVAVPRRAIANFLRSMAHTPGMTARDRLLALTTITFDISGLELHLPLWVGGTVHIGDRETALDAQRIRRLLETEPITIMQATPTTWRLLLEAGFQGGPRRLRMLCGGEAISPELARRLSAVGELWNMYGPTETTVWSTIKRIEPADERVTIGRPIDNTQVYVLDEQGGLMPLGEVGELCIGGLGVAQGYLGRPELTASKFVANRFGPEGDIIYRTGDLARLLANGELECLGRIDHQIKLRGFRIELGEIESAIRGVEGVREAVVTAPLGRQGEPRLVAYYVGSAEEPQIREQVRAKLPIYMHPSAYVAISEFPLNTNGKIDRKRLPVPDEEPSAASLTGAEAITDAEAKMAALFEEVLALPQVPVDRDFFELGGNSVKVMQLRRRVQETFGVEPSLNAMFDRPTVQRLVAGLTPELDPLAPAFVPLRRGRLAGPPLLCIFGVAIYRPLADALETERPVYGLHIPMRVGACAGVPSVEEIAARYVELICENVPEGPYHLAGLCFGGLVAYEIARQLVARGSEVRTLGIMDATLPRGARLDLLNAARALVAKFKSGGRPAPDRLYEQLSLVASQLPAFSRWRARLRPELMLPEGDLDVVSPAAQEIVRAYDAKGPKLRGAALLFRARERLEPSWQQAAWDLGWSQLADKVDVHVVSGSHLEILKPPNVGAIAKVLSRSLAS